jgi:hypothetical protein
MNVIVCLDCEPGSNTPTWSQTAKRRVTLFRAGAAQFGETRLLELDVR